MLKEISIQKAQWALANNQDIQLIDVRTVAEYRQGHISGSINIPLAHIRNCRIPKNKPIFVCCKSGGRSLQAKDALIAMGYADVTDIGSIDSWKLVSD